MSNPDPVEELGSVQSCKRSVISSAVHLVHHSARNVPEPWREVESVSAAKAQAALVARWTVE